MSNLKNCQPFQVTYCGIEFDPTTYSDKREFASHVWEMVFISNENEKWANEAKARAEFDWENWTKAV